ncbi:MAG: hypothetical protein U1A78_23220 [Polyangia bacterium]
MRPLAPLLLVLSVLLLGGAAAPPATPPAAAPAAAAPPAAAPAAVAQPPASPAPAASESECRPRDALRLLGEALALPVGSDTAAVAQALVRGDLELSFLLAMVPEPRLGFDGTVESLVRALETTGHTLDRYYLPWEAPSGDGARRRGGCQEQVPGVALFQRPAPGAAPDVVPAPASGRRRLMLLYLIGESPLAGAYKPAFARAVEQQRELRRALAELEPPAAPGTGRCARCEEVRLVGPAFSGGSASLETLLDAFPAESFTILSGRATNAAIQHELVRHSTPQRRVSMHATVIPDEALQTEFFCYLTETLGADPHDIALITESSTGYGQAVIAQNAAPTVPDARSQVLPGQRQPPQSARCRQPHRARLTLPVPLHVARLHNALVKSEGAARGDSESQPGAPRLPRVFDDSTRTDVIPTLSDRAVAATDRALAHILSTLSAEKIRYVGIIATDVQDKLFLAQQIRKYCPDVVLFTFESDILYTVPEARPYLKGMLVVSPYPLFTRNQLWSYPFRGHRQRIQFASDSDQGVFNAAVALIDPNEPLLEYSQAAPGVDSPRHRPAIWISAVGNETLFPLAFLKDYDDSGYLYISPNTESAQYQYAPYQQGALSLLLFVLGLGGVALSIGFWRVYYARSRQLRGPLRLLQVFRRCRFDFRLPVPLSTPGVATSRLTERSIGENEARRQPMFLLVLFLPITTVYFFLVLIHFMQLRDGNLALTVDEQRLSFWMQMWRHSGHIGIYGGMNWKVLFTGLFGSACEVVFLGIALDLVANYVAIDRRAELQERLCRFWDRQPPHRQGLLASLGLLAFLLLSMGLFALFVAFINRLQHDFNTLLFLRRCAQFAFGLSPLVPILLLTLGIQLWGYTHLVRIYLLERMTTVYLDVIAELEEEPSLRRHIVCIAAELQSPSRRMVTLGAAAAALFSGLIFSELVSLESSPWNIVFRFVIAALLTAIGYAFFRFLRLWLRVRSFLVALSHHPLSEAMGRMPSKLARTLGLILLEDMPEETARAVKLEHLRLILNHLVQLDEGRDLAPLLGSVDSSGELLAQLAELRALRPQVLRAPTPVPGAAPHPGHSDLEADADEGLLPEADPGLDSDAPGEQVLMQASRLLARVLRRFWSLRPLPGVLVASDHTGDKAGDKPAVQPNQAMLPAERNTADFYTELVPNSLHLWLRLAEDLLAVQVVSYINRLFPHLRNALLFCTFGFIAALATFSSYPFQPLRFLMISVWLFILGTLPITLYVLVQMNRDDVLSRLGRSEPGRVTFDRRFLSQIVLYGALPLLSLIATQFPGVRGVAFSWLESLLKALK